MLAALEGGRHLEFLLKNDLLLPTASNELDAVYRKNHILNKEKVETSDIASEEKLLITQGDAQSVSTLHEGAILGF